MKYGTDALNPLKAAYTAIANADTPAEAKAAVNDALTVLRTARPKVVADAPGLNADIVSTYGQLIDVLHKGLTALDGPQATNALSDLKALAKQGLEHMDRI